MTAKENQGGLVIQVAAYSLDQVMQPSEIFALGQKVMFNDIGKNEVFASAEAAKYFLMLLLAPCDQELFGCMFLDNQHQLIHFEILFYGLIGQASVYPREVTNRCQKYNAKAVILASNHPRCTTKPSRIERHITRNIIAALITLDVTVLDYIIVTMDGNSLSCAQEGTLF